VPGRGYGSSGSGWNRRTGGAPGDEGLLCRTTGPTTSSTASIVRLALALSTAQHTTAKMPRTRRPNPTMPLTRSFAHAGHLALEPGRTRRQLGQVGANVVWQRGQTAAPAGSGGSNANSVRHLAQVIPEWRARTACLAKVRPLSATATTFAKDWCHPYACAPRHRRHRSRPTGRRTSVRPFASSGPRLSTSYALAPSHPYELNQISAVMLCSNGTRMPSAYGHDGGCV